MSNRIGIAIGAVVGASVVATVAIGIVNSKSVITIKPDTVYIKASAKAAAVAETTTKVVTKTRTITDSVRINYTDTILVKEFITRVDTLLVQCDKCAKTLADFRLRSDSTIKVLRDSLALLSAKLASCKSQRPWIAIGGIALGGVVCLRK